MTSSDGEVESACFYAGMKMMSCPPPADMEAVRTKDWKYVRYFRSDKSQYGEEDVDFRGRQPDFEQFFDLNDDPGEEVNLIAEPGLQERIGDFRERCSQHSTALVLARQDTQTYPR